MIKGINRQVLEVNETDCDYFEKIMFFVRPEYASLSESRLKDTAGKIARCTGTPPSTQKNRNRFFEITKSLFFFLTGSAVTLALMNLLK